MDDLLGYITSQAKKGQTAQHISASLEAASVSSEQLVTIILELTGTTESKDAAAPTRKRFDAYEILPVVCYKLPGEVAETCEQAETWAEALNMVGEAPGSARALWRLYGHIIGDGVETIADVTTEDEARILLYKLTGIIATAGNPGPYMAKR